MVLTKPPSLLLAVTGRKYHYPPVFHCPREAVPIFEMIVLALHFCVIAYLSSGCRPSTDHRIKVPVMLLFSCQDSVEVFPFYLYKGEIEGVCKRFFYTDLKRLLSFTKIRLRLLCIFCLDSFNLVAHSSSVNPSIKSIFMSFFSCGFRR